VRQTPGADAHSGHEYRDSCSANTYAEADHLSIAYQVFGQGAVDLVFVPGIVSHVEMNWEDPAYARMLRALGAHFCVIMFDKAWPGPVQPL
jgi:hypothetical protein